MISIDLQAYNLPKQRLMQALKFSFNSTYFMEIFRGATDHKVKVFESEWFVDDPNHKFENIEMTDTQLCNGSDTELIEFRFIRRNQFLMSNEMVCHFTSSLNHMENVHNPTIPIPLLDLNKRKVAEVYLTAKTREIPRYTDYLNDGYKMNLVGAIDFTYSNGSCDSPNSLHYMDGSHGNYYVNCIQAVMKVLH